MKKKIIYRQKRKRKKNSPEGKKTQEANSQDNIRSRTSKANGLTQNAVHDNSKRQGDEAHAPCHQIAVVRVCLMEINDLIKSYFF